MLLALPICWALCSLAKRREAAHVLTGTILDTLPASADGLHYAMVQVDTVERGPLTADRHHPVTIEYSADQQLATGCTARLFADENLRLIEPDGIETISKQADWQSVRTVLQQNWLSSRYLRSQRPPSLRRSLSGTVALIRDVTVRECGWLERDLRRGERFTVYAGHTYGVISPAGVAVQPEGASDSEPFMELPANALSPTPAKSER